MSSIFLKISSSREKISGWSFTSICKLAVGINSETGSTSVSFPDLKCTFDTNNLYIESD